MEVAVEDVVIIGAGLAGLATAIGLHRMGIKSLVLESSSELRASGYAINTWGNAWRAMDELGVGDSLRPHTIRLHWETTTSASSGALTSKLSLTTQGKCGEDEVRCLRRNLLLEMLEKALPQGTVRFSSKLVSIEQEEASNVKLLHLADGSTLKTKVLVGCDGINSLVAKWLGFKKPSYSGRSSSRGFTVFPNGHGFNHEFAQYYGKGFRCGILPCDDNSVFWFFNAPTSQVKGIEDDATKMKQFILKKISGSKIPEEVAEIVEKSEMGNMCSFPLSYRWPFELFWANISKGNVCVAGDALHPMAPNIGQGGCSALKDGVVLARCLGNAILSSGGKVENERIKEGLAKYAKERRWRSFDLIATSCVLGFIQESDGWIMNFLRDKVFPGFLTWQHQNKAAYDFGKLSRV